MLRFRQRYLVSKCDAWLDEQVADRYATQPMAQDWARVAKVIEELGESIGELILWTGQNPRKGQDDAAFDRMLGELCDVAWTGIFALQHFTKDDDETSRRLAARLERIAERVGIV